MRNSDLGEEAALGRVVGRPTQGAPELRQGGHGGLWTVLSRLTQCRGPKKSDVFTEQKEGGCPHSESRPQAGLQVSAWVLCLYHCPEKNTPRLARWPRRMEHMWSRASQAQPRGANSPPICTSQRRNSFHFKPGTGTSLLVQWLTLRLPTQGTGVRSLVQKIPHAWGQLRSCATTTGACWPRSLCS